MPIKPKKSLGQNFLREEQVLDAIVTAANIQPTDFVLEIGPGEGVLTEKLLEKAGKVMAIEIDQRLIEQLQEKFAAKSNFELIHADILKMNLAEAFGHPVSKGTPSVSPEYKVVANLPYYITSPIIRLFLESETPPSEMILMVQKEVAERITASPREIPTTGRDAKRISRGKPGQMSILAVAVQYYAAVELLLHVGKEAFYPAPKVDSAVIKVVRRKGEVASKGDTKHFFRVVKAGFSAKRKTLSNNLANSLHLEKAEISQKLKIAGISPTVRAQELSVEDWKKLALIFV